MVGQHTAPNVRNRLQKELLNLTTSKIPGISVLVDGDNISKWVATVDGPSDTVFANQKYRIFLEFPPDYPFCPPRVKFITNIFHPNVLENNGVVCLDVLQIQWSASFDVRFLLLSLQSLLRTPNMNLPMNIRAAAMWFNQKAYKEEFLKDFNASND